MSSIPSIVSVECSSPKSAVKVGDQLRPHCSFSLSTLHAALLALAQEAVVRDPWSPPVVRRSLPHPSVRTEHTPINLTPALLDFPLSGARLHPSARPRLLTPHAAAAHGHTPNQNRSRDCSCPSIRHECGDRVSRFHHSSRRAAHSLEPVPIHNHFVTRTGCLCTDEVKAAPLCSCVPSSSKSTGHSDHSTLAHVAQGPPCVKIARVLLHVFKCDLFPRYLPLLPVSSSREQSRPSASTVRALCELRGGSPWSFSYAWPLC